MRNPFKKRRKAKQQCRIYTSYGDIDFLLSRSSYRSTIAISIGESANVTVAAPTFVSLEEIHSFIKEKASWINTHRNTFRKNERILSARKYDNSHSFMFLGKKYPISLYFIEKGRGGIEFDGDKWRISIPGVKNTNERQQMVRKKLISWYRNQAKEILGGRVFHFSRQINKDPVEISIRTQQRRWGSCNYTTKSICLNWQIILAPMDVVDYVVVHELCHLVVPNHSQRFWKKVEKYLPDYVERRKWLKAHALDLRLPTI